MDEGQDQLRLTRSMVGAFAWVTAVLVLVFLVLAQFKLPSVWSLACFFTVVCTVSALILRVGREG